MADFFFLTNIVSPLDLSDSLVLVYSCYLPAVLLKSPVSSRHELSRLKKKLESAEKQQRQHDHAAECFVLRS